MSTPLELATTLINNPSITPNDADCQTLLRQRLTDMAFDISDVSYEGVTNTWARLGTEGPLLVFSGHTDVVPPGPLHQWISPPFEATVRGQHLYGRGAADMKSALAAMMIACQNFLKKHPAPKGSLAFMLTSDEEGKAKHGTQKLVEFCQTNNITVDWCIIGEATSVKQLGDSIKIGRRGSLHGNLKVIGKQGHIAYPHLADNPIHRSFKALDALTNTQWDEGNEHFDPTSFQIYHINADTGATNVIPGTLTASFNFRFAPSSNAESLKQRVHEIFDQNELHYEIDWGLSSKPFYSKQGKLTQACQKVIAEICHIDTLPNTKGGTSDGRFIADLGCEIVELGPINESIHQVNENIAVADLETLATLYERILEELLL
ncbi:MAG: succinyl-diaminopimelate desuccinylase [Coxiella sp. (in: Bacteria)]|nr:MAG: succinyl-diaminopimelate desuccinylase [Coxiella sp. (in: g-proteobacteria)]